MRGLKENTITKQDLQRLNEIVDFFWPNQTPSFPCTHNLCICLMIFMLMLNNPLFCIWGLNFNESKLKQERLSFER